MSGSLDVQGSRRKRMGRWIEGELYNPKALEDQAQRYRVRIIVAAKE